MIGRLRLVADAAADLEAVDLGQVAVQQDDVRILGFPALQRLLTVDGGEHVVALAPQRVGHQIQQIDVVVDDQNLHEQTFSYVINERTSNRECVSGRAEVARRVRRGMRIDTSAARTRNFAPPPRRLSTPTRPAWASTIDLTMDSPRPTPSFRWRWRRRAVVRLEQTLGLLGRDARTAIGDRDANRVTLEGHADLDVGVLRRQTCWR